MMQSGNVRIIEEVFKGKKIVVIGDLMVDEYVTGKVTRISPEAPVPVLNYGSVSRTAGGASNVVKNVRALGAEVYAVGIASDDEAGQWLRNDFINMGIKTDGIFTDTRPTIIKTRYATKGQQLLRVDHEVNREISDSAKANIINYLEQLLSQTDAVILSDYCKGLFADNAFVKELLVLCHRHDVFVAIDSKRTSIECFAGADVIKPNNLELEAAVGVLITDSDSLDRAGATYLEKSGAKLLMVTRGANGITVFEKGKARVDFAADRKAQVYDVTGAGDTVISTVTLAIISGMSVADAMKLANLAAGIVISKVGTVAINGSELADEIRRRQDL